MGWKNDSPCWYCNADLAALMSLPECFDELAGAEFERHMQGLCIADPQTDWERKASEKIAQEMEESRAWDLVCTCELVR